MRVPKRLQASLHICCSLSSVLLASACLVSCRVIDLPDGKLPVGSQAAAMAFTGVYHGQSYYKPSTGPNINHEARTVWVQIRGLEVTLASDGDWIAPRCHSSVGLLRQVIMSNDSKTVEKAIFNFNPGQCASDVDSREMVVNLFGRTRDGRIKMFYWVDAKPSPIPTSPSQNFSYEGELVHD